MKDSKTDYCIQGADFIANALYKFYNKKNDKWVNYITVKKCINLKFLPWNHYKNL